MILDPVAEPGESQSTIICPLVMKSLQRFRVTKLCRIDGAGGG